MKKTALFLFAGILTIWSVHAQGTLEFTCTLTGGNVVPSSGSPFLGDGRFWLEGTTLNFALGVYSMSPEPTGAQLRGPTDASTSAPVLFDLGPGFSVNPDGFNHWQTWAWGGAVTGLSSQDIADLSGGRWYANITTTAFPEGELRGQILAVPEPAVSVLLALGLCALPWSWRKMSRSGERKPNQPKE